MAETAVIVRRWRMSINDDGTENALTFDAVIRESHVSELEVTEQPVETGVVLSDHAYMLPSQIVIDGAFSDTPMPGQRNGGYGVIVGGEGVKASADNGQSRSANAWTILTRLQELAVPLDVQTGLKLYKDMVIRRLTCDQTKETAGALFFVAELKQVQFATSQTVTYAARATRAPKRAQQKKKIVDKTTKDPTASEGQKAEQAESLLFKVLGAR